MKNYKKTFFDYPEVLPSNNMMVSEYGVQEFEQNKCLYCYEELNDDNANFHQACNKKFFGQLETPLLNYNYLDLEKLAQNIINSKMAVTGVQPKLSLSFHRKKEKNVSKKLTLVGLYGDYILKPPSAFYEQLPEVEDMTMRLAEVCGLKTVPHTLVNLADGTRCYLTKRIDRTKKGMLHMEDMCQLTERLTEDKYKGSHEQVAKAILKYSSNPLLDVTNFYELVIFSFLTGNADMHLKNFSLIENNLFDGYTLAPAYDLLSTKLVNEADTEELALTLNGKKSKLKYDDFLAAFEKSGLTKKVLDTTLENFYYCTKEMKKKMRESFMSEEFKNKFETLFNSRCERILLFR
ncbi:MAG: HipA domain-containing protein [Chitinophagaceae bacterium]|nr:HipA domain-containing protein [Chitinophagaceae bacterium]